MYHVKKEDQLSLVIGDGKWRRFQQFPLIRALIQLFLLAMVILPANLLTMNVIESLPEPMNTILNLMKDLLVLYLLFRVMRFYMNRFEKRLAHEFSVKKSPQEFLIGVLIALVLILFMVLLMAALGYYRIAALNSPTVLLGAMMMFGIGALLQEILFRQILFRAFEELLGTWFGVVAIGLVFGMMHIVNPNATLWSSLALMAADLLLSAVYVHTRRIWMVWGLHFSWNFFQAGVFGMPNSGITFPSLIQADISGPQWLSGGPFGIEASILSVNISLILGLLLLYIADRRGMTWRPSWKR